jgi:CDP-glucose 4,6-dehydratase
MELIQFSDTYRGCRVLVTGHTGFKGSWLILWLKQLGALVAGIALDPETQPNHYDLLNLELEDQRVDVRDGGKVRELIESFRPDIVFHLAAQALVQRSYRDPIESWSCNVMGTANVLEACRKVDSVRAIVAVTTDKVYANQEWSWGYRENDRLGGHDPYSASKAACELLIDSYRHAFYSSGNGPLLASARAGNVIGGGDWSEDRLIPDLVRSLDGEPLVIRSPNATRPWQHVLECLSGYLLLGHLLLEDNSHYSAAWNFGPKSEDNRSVSEILNIMRTHWPKLNWESALDPLPHEATLLYLDHSKAKDRLKWEPVWSLEKAVKATTDWYCQFREQGIVLSVVQLEEYIFDAFATGVTWVEE